MPCEEEAERSKITIFQEHIFGTYFFQILRKGQCETIVFTSSNRKQQKNHEIRKKIQNLCNLRFVRLCKKLKISNE